MSNLRTKILLVLGIVSLAGSLPVWWQTTRPAKPSRLMTETDLLGALRQRVVPEGYLISGSSERSAGDPSAGRQERTFECKLVHKDNVAVEGKQIVAGLERWLGTLVQVQATEELPGGTNELRRVFRYAAGQTTGEVRCTLQPVPGATFTLNGQSGPGNVQSLALQISERRRR